MSAVASMANSGSQLVGLSRICVFLENSNTNITFKILHFRVQNLRIFSFSCLCVLNYAIEYDNSNLMTQYCNIQLFSIFYLFLVGQTGRKRLRIYLSPSVKF